MEGDLSDGELPDDQIQPPSRDDRPDADPALVRRGRASSYPPTASDRAQKPVDATLQNTFRQYLVIKYLESSKYFYIILCLCFCL